MSVASQDQSARRDWLGQLARAPEGRIRAHLKAADIAAEFALLRAPEIGSVMVQGRAGGTGGPFNVGEMTVTRCSLRLGTGEIGHGYVQGRSKDAAEAAALVDALMQTGRAAEVRAAVLAPLSEAAQVRKDVRAEKAAATKVEFFTLVRGED